MKKIGLVLVFFLVFACCDSKLMDGYTELGSGIFYKIHTLGDGEMKARSGDKIYAQLDIYGSSGKRIYCNNLRSGSLHSFNLSNTNSIWNKIFGVLHEGDSATFSMPGETIQLDALTNGKIKSYAQELTLSIKLWKLFSEQDQNLLKIQIADADNELLELKTLSNFFETKGVNPEKLLVDGIYLKYLKRGNGAKAVSGDNVWINYTGYFLNGKEFDNTYKRGQMLDFQLGKPDQVVRGFEIALSKMREGDKVRIYLTSTFAFGDQGSSNGQVPPFTSVIFDLQLFQVN